MKEVVLDSIHLCYPIDFVVEVETMVLDLVAVDQVVAVAIDLGVDLGFDYSIGEGHSDSMVGIFVVQTDLVETEM